MTLKGKIKNGRILLDKPHALPEGTEVEVRAVKKPRNKPTKKPEPKRPTQTLADSVRPFIGVAKGLPPDLSANIDHYLYGRPKRK